MVELPHGHLACPKQFPCIPFHVRRVNEALAVVQPSANWHANAKPAPLEWEEPDVFRSVREHGDAGIGAAAINGDCELWAQKRVRQRSCLALHRMPRGNFVWPELARSCHRDLQLTSPFTPYLGEHGRRPRNTSLRSPLALTTHETCTSDHQAELFPVKFTPPWPACAVAELTASAASRQVRCDSTRPVCNLLSLIISGSAGAKVKDGIWVTSQSRGAGASMVRQRDPAGARTAVMTSRPKAVPARLLRLTSMAQVFAHGQPNRLTGRHAAGLDPPSSWV